MSKKEKTRQRGENWVQEEKDLFIEIMYESASIIESKQTDTNTLKKKNEEWKKIQRKLRELTGKSREVAQLKGFWRRSKITAKKNLSEHRRATRGTGGGLPSPLQKDLKIKELCATDFAMEDNKFDSDGISQFADHIVKDEAQHNSTIYDIEITENNDSEEEAQNLEVIPIADVHANEVDIQKIEKIKVVNKKDNNEKKKHYNIKEYPKKTNHNESSHEGAIVSSSTEFKKQTLKFMEEEHKLKMKYLVSENIHQELRHKLEIDILLLEKQKKELELNKIKNQ